MFCSQCGFQVDNSSLFCSKCGNSLKPSSSYTAPTPDVRIKGHNTKNRLFEIDGPLTTIFQQIELVARNMKLHDIRVDHEQLVILARKTFGETPQVIGLRVSHSSATNRTYLQAVCEFRQSNKWELGFNRRWLDRLQKEIDHVGVTIISSVEIEPPLWSVRDIVPKSGFEKFSDAIAAVGLVGAAVAFGVGRVAYDAAVDSSLDSDSYNLQRLIERGVRRGLR